MAPFVPFLCGRRYGKYIYLSRGRIKFFGIGMQGDHIERFEVKLEKILRSLINLIQGRSSNMGNQYVEFR